MGFLLNSALWAIKYNKFVSKNPKLKPVVVYLTMENSIDETIKRIWSHAFGNNSEMSQYEPAQAARMLEEQRIFTPNKPDLPELVIWHRSTKSINTADMNSMLDDLEKDGKECVFLVQDYVKRIRSTVNHKELRFELSIVSDEFSSIAKEREIPILTAMQMNR
jgi:replicative DNA helicase